MSTFPIVITEEQADISSTETSTAQTVDRMRKHINQAVNDPAVQRVALECLRASDGSRRGICEAVWLWLKQNVTFVPDEVQIRKMFGREDELELLISPSVMVRMQDKQGDCDCFTMTACALLWCCSVPPLIKTFKCDRKEPWRWAHVCAAGILEDGSAFPVDASHGDYPGWEVPQRDTFESQYWGMDGNQRGERMKPSRGMNGYVPDRNWTGSLESTYKGRHAGIYPSRDFLRAYYPARMAGLQAIAKGKFAGLGACVNGFDEYGDACTDFTPITSDPAATAAAINYLYNTPSAGPGGVMTPAPGSSPSLASILASLIPAGTRLGQQALATPGTTILPNGTVIAGTPQGTSALTSMFGGISPLLLVGGLFALILVLGKK